MTIGRHFTKIAVFLIIVSLVATCAPAQPAQNNVDDNDTKPTTEIIPSATPHPDEINDAQGVTMRLVPAGEFTMGSELEENQKPAHAVYLDTFYIDKYEVTNQAYEKCVDAGVCLAPGNKSSFTRKEYYGNPEFANYPVIYATWIMANTYCQWRAARLPTEAEWEKAARGTDARMYPWGSEFGCSFANMVIQGQPCVGDTTAVGSYETGISPYGLYDMAGNVGEWTSSILKPYPYDKNDGREDPSVLRNHIVRGGTWYYENETFSRVTKRDALNSMTNDPDIGFRCAMEVIP